MRFRYLVRNQSSGFHWSWVRASNDCGVPETDFDQVTIDAVPNPPSGFGWNSPGCCVVRYCASAVTADVFGLVTDALMSVSAAGSAYPPMLSEPDELNTPSVVG